VQLPSKQHSFTSDATSGNKLSGSSSSIAVTGLGGGSSSLADLPNTSLVTAGALMSEDILRLSNKIITVFNFFITFGDQFLPQQSDYDDLYYELLRTGPELKTFINAVEASETNPLRVEDVDNIKSILSHFNEKIDNWSHNNAGATISTDIVLKIIRGNYESLRLKLHENLDKISPYTENPNEIVFFAQLVRHITSLTRASTMNIITSE